MTNYKKWNPNGIIYISESSEDRIYSDCIRSTEIINLNGKSLNTLLKEKGYSFPQMDESSPLVIEQAKTDFMRLFKTIIEETLLNELESSVDKKKLAELISTLFGQKGIAYFGPTSIANQLIQVYIMPEKDYTVDWNVDRQGYLTVTTNTKITVLKSATTGNKISHNKDTPFATTISRATLQFDLDQIKIKEAPVLVNLLSTPYPRIEEFFNGSSHKIIIKSSCDSDIDPDPLYLETSDQGNTLEPINSLPEVQLILETTENMDLKNSIDTLNTILNTYKNHLSLSNTTLSNIKAPIIGSAISALNNQNVPTHKKLSSALDILIKNEAILEKNQTKEERGFLNSIKAFLIDLFGIKSEGKKVMEKVEQINGYQFFKAIHSPSAKEEEPQNKPDLSV